jgi:Tetratricopeptide repeat
MLLADRLRVLGPDHRSTLYTRHNVAYFRRQRGDVAAAIEDFEAVLADQVRLLGRNDSDTLQTRKEVAILRGKLGDPHRERRAMSSPGASPYAAALDAFSERST